MDPQVAYMIRNITGFWILLHMYCSLTFLKIGKRIQENDFMWHLHGILSVTYSMEVGVCICYLWTKHSCSGFILKEDWVNWCSWILILVFYMVIIFLILNFFSNFFSSFLIILLFSVNFANIEGIIFSMPIFRLFFVWFLPLILSKMHSATGR